MTNSMHVLYTFEVVGGYIEQNVELAINSIEVFQQSSQTCLILIYLMTFHFCNLHFRLETFSFDEVCWMMSCPHEAVYLVALHIDSGLTGDTLFVCHLCISWLFALGHFFPVCISTLCGLWYQESISIVRLETEGPLSYQLINSSLQSSACFIFFLCYFKKMKLWNLSWRWKRRNWRKKKKGLLHMI